MQPLVVKVGGSLYDLPDLGARLRRWLATHNTRPVLLVPGGGAAADVIRAYDQTHQLGEETSHWLALAMLAVNAQFLAALLPAAVVRSVPSPGDAVTILDMHAFAVADEARADHLPHRWAVTSDSFAVRVADLTEAEELVLLKSAPWAGDDWSDAAKAGVVDYYFPEAIRRAKRLRVGIVNLREDRWARHRSGRRGTTIAQNEMDV